MADLVLKNPATTETFRAMLADENVTLPINLSESDVGVILGADGRDVLVIDVNSERPDPQVAEIANLIIFAVNTYGGFRAEVRWAPASPPVGEDTQAARGAADRLAEVGEG